MTNNIDESPDNSLNNFNPNLIGQNFINSNIRSISNVSSGFSKYPNQIFEGTDYVILENARKLDENEYSINEKLGFISLNQFIFFADLNLLSSFSISSRVYPCDCAIFKISNSL